MSANYFKAILAASIGLGIAVMAASTNNWMMIFVGSVGVGLAMDQMYRADRD